MSFLQNNHPDDIFLWPDDTYCERNEWGRGEMSHMSDDFMVVSINHPKYNDVRSGRMTYSAVCRHIVSGSPIDYSPEAVVEINALKQKINDFRTRHPLEPIPGISGLRYEIKDVRPLTEHRVVFETDSAKEAWDYLRGEDGTFPREYLSIKDRTTNMTVAHFGSLLTTGVIKTIEFHQAVKREQMLENEGRKRESESWVPTGEEIDAAPVAEVLKPLSAQEARELATQPPVNRGHEPLERDPDLGRAPQKTQPAPAKAPRRSRGLDR